MSIKLQNTINVYFFLQHDKINFKLFGPLFSWGFLFSFLWRRVYIFHIGKGSANHNMTNFSVIKKTVNTNGLQSCFQSSRIVMRIHRDRTDFLPQQFNGFFKKGYNKPNKKSEFSDAWITLFWLDKYDQSDNGCKDQTPPHSQSRCQKAKFSSIHFHKHIQKAKLTFKAVAAFFHSGVSLWQWPHLLERTNKQKMVNVIQIWQLFHSHSKL